jgi:DNA-binding transcriptional MerR regulator
MKATNRELYQAQEFARRAGVTVRTLHIYDRMGLLAPAERTESGYRLYGQAELERLEQIVALRFVGFSLNEIKELLALEPLPMLTALRMQREIVRQRRNGLDRAMAAIDRAEQAAAAGEPSAVWETLRTLIEAMKMEKESQEIDWSKYYSPEAMKTIKAQREKLGEDGIKAGERAWTELLAEVESSVNEDPASAHAQDLARRWKELLAQFTGGNPGVQSGLNKFYRDPQGWPKDFKRPWSDAADDFIKKAMNCAS